MTDPYLFFNLARDCTIPQIDQAYEAFRKKWYDYIPGLRKKLYQHAQGMFRLIRDEVVAKVIPEPPHGTNKKKRSLSPLAKEKSKCRKLKKQLATAEVELATLNFTTASYKERYENLQSGQACIHRQNHQLRALLNDSKADKNAEVARVYEQLLMYQNDVVGHYLRSEIKKK